MRKKKSSGVLYLVFLFHHLFVFKFLQYVFIPFIIKGEKASNECYKKICLRLKMPFQGHVSIKKKKKSKIAKLTAGEQSWPCHFAIGLSMWCNI